jgi:hypothetical protein
LSVFGGVEDIPERNGHCVVQNVKSLLVRKCCPGAVLGLQEILMLITGTNVSKEPAAFWSAAS